MKKISLLLRPFKSIQRFLSSIFQRDQHSKTNSKSNEITVEVTQDDINHGRRCNSYKCPVAIALRRTSFSFYRRIPYAIEVNETWYRIGCKFYATPQELSQFIYGFDGFYSVKPITVTFIPKEIS